MNKTCITKEAARPGATSLSESRAGIRYNYPTMSKGLSIQRGLDVLYPASRSTVNPPAPGDAPKSINPGAPFFLAVKVLLGVVGIAGFAASMVCIATMGGAQ